MWHSDGPSVRPGCDGWEQSMQTPEMQLLSRIRRGAHALAGIRN
jgi:hypothetical protein